jgi:hypothetical protein
MDQMVFLHPKTSVYIAAICRLILRQANVTAKKENHLVNLGIRPEKKDG